MRLNQSELLNLLVRSIQGSGWDVLVADRKKPFELRVFRSDHSFVKLYVYIWNCTHGGGAARARDEYRIQFTGVVPRAHPGATTLLLGWHSGYEVFAAWDIGRHDGQDSASPSAQIREDVLRQAHVDQFSVGVRSNSEIVVAFRPEFIVDYSRVSLSLHRGEGIGNVVEMLNSLPKVADSDLFELGDVDRREVVATIVKRYRAADFRKRVLGAYGHRCAMCGVQLELLDAAHILPVAHDNSTDDTTNGIALCKLHHAAFDRNLLSFNEDYSIQVSSSETRRLGALDRLGGLSGFSRGLKPVLILPSDRRDYPASRFIALSRRARNWLP